MSEDKVAYRQILKATTIFGGVKVFNIFIAIIKSKIVAVLLGTAGMGIMGLLTSTTGFVTSLTNFGLGTSAVKDVSAAFGTGNQKKVSVIIIILRRWVWITGLLGMIVTIITAPFLSRITFGNTEFTFPFIWISVSLLLAQLSSGQIIILQGLRKLKQLAKANLSGSILGLILTVPLYYLVGIDGIIPSIIISSVISLCSSWFFARKINIEKVYVSKARTIAEGKNMLKMGFVISISGIITIGTSYLIKIFIRNQGSIDQVGLYTAGFALLNSYVGIVLNAMATDYFPRLCENAMDNKLCEKKINEQAVIAVLLLAPIIVSFLVFSQWILILLYSNKFLPITTMMQWAALGMFFRAASWTISFVFVAKGHTRMFFGIELAANAYTFILNIVGYYFYGLDGIGIAFLLGYILYLLQVYFISKSKYNFNFHWSFYKIFIFQISIALICFIIVRLFINPINYLLGTILLLIVTVFSFIELNKRINIWDIFLKYARKK